MFILLEVILAVMIVVNIKHLRELKQIQREYEVLLQKVRGEK